MTAVELVLVVHISVQGLCVAPFEVHDGHSLLWVDAGLQYERLLQRPILVNYSRQFRAATFLLLVHSYI